jgi:hypothetical protein
MKPSWRAFGEELLLLKLSAALEQVAPAGQEVQQEKVDEAKLLARALLNWGGYGVGFGLGTGLGYLTAEKFMPKTFSPGARTFGGVATGVLGGLGALATWEAIRKAHESENDAAQRDDQGL